MNIQRKYIFTSPSHRTASLLCLMAASWMAGCSSPDANETYTNLKLNEIHQAPGGQLALIFDEKRGQPPGQRVFLADSKETDRDVHVAMEEITADKRFGETFAGGVILHRRKAMDGVSPDTFWIQLDPFELTGTWAPSLSEPALPPATVAESLPLESNSTITLILPGQTLLPPITPSLPDVRFVAAKPEQHFLWQTANGIYETSVSAQPLIHVDQHPSMSKQTRQVLGDGIFLAAYGGVLALAVWEDLHDDCHPDYSHHR